MVGAGGIGFHVINCIKFFDYGRTAIFIFVVFVVAIIIDGISVKVKEKNHNIIALGSYFC